LIYLVEDCAGVLNLWVVLVVNGVEFVSDPALVLGWVLRVWLEEESTLGQAERRDDAIWGRFKQAIVRRVGLAVEELLKLLQPLQRLVKLFEVGIVVRCWVELLMDRIVTRVTVRHDICHQNCAHTATREDNEEKELDSGPPSLIILILRLCLL